MIRLEGVNALSSFFGGYPDKSSFLSALSFFFSLFFLIVVLIVFRCLSLPLVVIFSVVLFFRPRSSQCVCSFSVVTVCSPFPLVFRHEDPEHFLLPHLANALRIPAPPVLLTRSHTSRAPDFPKEMKESFSLLHKHFCIVVSYLTPPSRVPSPTRLDGGTSD